MAEAGTVAAAIYFKLLPGEIAQLPAAWSQKLSFTSRDGSVSALADVQLQVVNQTFSPDNTAAVSANSQSNAAVAATVTPQGQSPSRLAIKIRVPRI